MTHPADPSDDNDGMMEFEVTDFDSARAALDELPAGVGAKPPKTEAELASMRRPVQATDKALSGSTIDWLLSLPPSRRPATTCERFPRAINLIAEVWENPTKRHEVFNGLLHDTRRQRQGFPPEVKREIEGLEVFAASAANGTPRG